LGDTLAHCRKILGEHDYDIVVDFETPEKAIARMRELENKYSQSSISRLLISMRPQLQRMQRFAAIVFLGIGTTRITAACLWGATSLLIEVGRVPNYC
jgi:predicted metal-binding protein